MKSLNSFIMSYAALLVLLLAILTMPLGVWAQEDATLEPTFTPIPTEMPTLTETPTELPTATQTSTLTETPTQTATLTETVTETPTQTATLTETPTQTLTETVSPTLTETPTLTAPLEPELGLRWQTQFETEELSEWILGNGWGRTTLPQGGYGLAVFNSLESAQVIMGETGLGDFVLETHFSLNQASALIDFRQSEVGYYTLQLDESGVVTLYKTGQILEVGQATLGLSGQTHLIRVSAIGAVLRVAVDGVEVLVTEDVSPLPAGQIAFRAIYPSVEVDVTPFPPMNTLTLESISIFVPLSELPTPTETPLDQTITPELETATPTETLSPTATLTETEVTPEPTSGAFNDDDPRWSYAAGTWQAVEVDEAYLGTLTYTTDVNATATFPFTGTGLEIWYSQGEGGSTFIAQVFDAENALIAGQTIDSNALELSYTHPIVFENLPLGDYQVVLTNGEGFLWIEGGQIYTDIVTLTPTSTPTLEPTPLPAVDTSTWSVFKAGENGIEYAGGIWETLNAPEAFGGVRVSTSELGATATFHFMGRGVEILYRKSEQGSTFTTELVDNFGNSLETYEIDTFAEGTEYSASLILNDLPPDFYHLVITNASAGTLSLEGFRVLSLEPTWQPIHQDELDGTNGYLWSFDPNFMGQDYVAGVARLTGWDTPAYLNLSQADIRAKIRLMVDGGAATLGVRCGYDCYQVRADSYGQVSIFRTGLLLGSTNISALPINSWFDLEVEVVADKITVRVNDTEVLTAVDPNPLLPGAIALIPDFQTDYVMTVDRVEVWNLDYGLQAENTPQEPSSKAGASSFGKVINSDGSTSVPLPAQAGSIPPGKIYHGYQNSFWLMRADNSERQQLPQRIGGILAPTGDRYVTTKPYSPSGPYNDVLKVYDLSGGFLYDILLDNPSDMLGGGPFAWSPDGNKIALRRSIDNSASEISFIDLSTCNGGQVPCSIIPLATDLRQLHVANDAWSPNSQYIVFSSYLQINNQQRRQILMGDTQSLAVSQVPLPDETVLNPCYTTDWQGQCVPVVNHYFSYDTPSWSPTGNHIITEQRAQATYQNMCSILPSGGIQCFQAQYSVEINIVVADPFSGVEQHSTRLMYSANSTYEYNGYAPGPFFWSPDGEYVAFTRGGYGQGNSQSGINIMRPDGTVVWEYLQTGVYDWAEYNYNGLVVTTVNYEPDPLVVNGKCSLSEAIYAANNNVQVEDCGNGSGAEADVIYLAPTDGDTFYLPTEVPQTYLPRDGFGKTIVPSTMVSASRNVNECDTSVIADTTYCIGGNNGSTSIEKVIVIKPARGQVQDQFGEAYVIDAGDIPDNPGGETPILTKRVFRVEADATLILEGVTIRGGRTDENGGAIHVLPDATLIVRSVCKTYASISSPTDPDYVRCQSYDSTQIPKFINNRATENGGAIYNQGRVLIENRTIFEFNRAQQHGGAIYNADGGTLQVANGIFRYNTALGQGGAIYNHEDSIANADIQPLDTSQSPIPILNQVTSSCIFNNAAPLGGGAFIYELADMTFTDVWWGGLVDGQMPNDTTVNDSLGIAAIANIPEANIPTEISSECNPTPYYSIRSTTLDSTGSTTAVTDYCMVRILRKPFYDHLTNENGGFYDPWFTQEMVDMRSVVTTPPSPLNIGDPPTNKIEGLLMHYGPTLNSPMQRTVLSTLDHKWNGRYFVVTKRVQFPATGTPEQVWYYVEFDIATHTAPNGVSIKGGWFVARYGDFFYVEGAGVSSRQYPYDNALGQMPDSDPCQGYVPTINDPNDPVYFDDPDPANKDGICVTDPTFCQITFYYDRQATAAYAILQGKANHDNYPVGDPVGYVDPDYDRRVTQRISDQIFPNFDYAGQGTSGTSSALFTSETIWVGGLPMTSLIIPTEACPQQSDQENGGPWCLAPSSNNGYYPSDSWGLHPALMAYYTGNAEPLVSRYTNNILSLSPLGDFIIKVSSTTNASPPSVSANRADRVATESLGNYFTFTTQTPKVDLGGWAERNLHNQPISFGSPSIRTGDYIIIDSPSDPHGLIIVGWGQFAASDTCQNLIDNPVAIGSLTTTWSNGTVPFVVDYSYDTPTGVDLSVFDRTQTPIARPFFCTKVKLVPDFFGTPHDWYFFSMPDFVTLNANQLNGGN